MATLYLHAAFIDVPILSCSCAPPHTQPHPTLNARRLSPASKAPRQSAAPKAGRYKALRPREAPLTARAPPARFDWFDARHNKKCKHLKDVTVDFVFGKDDCFVPGL